MATNKKPVAPANKKSANAALRSAGTWDSIDWNYHRMIVKKLQLRIAKATLAKKFRKVKSLQWILTHSLSAKLIAVKNVMKNKGSKTPGVDGIIIKTPAEKLALAKSIKRRGYQPSPLRRIYIPKAGNNKKLRPLGIPTVADRCQQALYSLSLIPVSEVTEILQPSHPYDRKYDEYFEKQTSGKWRNNSKRLSIDSYINMIQQGKCPCCTGALKINQNWSISLKRKASQGGEYKLDNIDVVHD